KSSRTPNIKKGFHMACEDVGVKRKFAIYSGDDTFPLGNETTAISLPLFMQELLSATMKEEHY
ncbi:MAG: ATPase, partial [Candidatus Porifericomitaceae bacterium WSBS_2022_MAG_OTU9]